jgi:phosphoglycolate phosphatase-like HAD superfamily hydrolase
MIVVALCFTATGFADDTIDPLPSWNSGESKSAILQFVSRTTEPDSKDFVPESERIVVFDNDGTLWAEQPMYFQLLFAIDMVKELAPHHPEWKTKEPFASILKGDVAAALRGSEHSILALVMETHSGVTTDEFEARVRKWITSAQHPIHKRAIRGMVYKPMLELLSYLRQKGFKAFIVSGGGIEFMRPWVEEVYGIPPERVIGSSVKVQYEERGAIPVLVRMPSLNFLDDKEGKPVGIHYHIGRRPIAAFGNSDGDLQMLRWATSGPRPGFALYVHHTDSVREWRYDRDSHVGRLDKGLDEARSKKWVIVDMKSDWREMFPE